MEHVPVLLKETLHYLSPSPGETMVDCTLGGGGHAEALLRCIGDGRLLGIDRDQEAIERVKKRLAGNDARVRFVHANYDELHDTLEREGFDAVDGILYDLGVSSYHFDDGERGFSYRIDAPLDMRMDQRDETSAQDIVNTWSESDLVRILRRYGEESHAPRIARALVRAREVKPIVTTFDLVELVKSAMPQRALKTKGHPAKQTFQALRIAVNDELGALERSLKQALGALAPGGRLVVISFHSLEDRIVKTLFREACTVDHPEGLPTMPEETPRFEPLHKRVIVPSEDEVAVNRRAHSAKLRAIRKIKL